MKFLCAEGIQLFTTKRLSFHYHKPKLL